MAYAYNLVKLKVDHIESVFVVQEHEFGMLYVEPDKFGPVFMLTQHERHWDLADEQVDRVDSFVDVAVFLLLWTGNHHVPPELHLVFLQHYLPKLAALQEDVMVESLTQSIAVQNDLFSVQH